MNDRRDLIYRICLRFNNRKYLESLAIFGARWPGSTTHTMLAQLHGRVADRVPVAQIRRYLSTYFIR